MVIDASALVAILAREPDWKIYQRAIVRATTRLISPVNWFEAALVVERPGHASFAALEAFTETAGLTVVPVTAEHMRLAHKAWRNFGKGHHPARLNMGDCFAYALARLTHEPLLYKDADFTGTDITPAL